MSSEARCQSPEPRCIVLPRGGVVLTMEAILFDFAVLPLPAKIMTTAASDSELAREILSVTTSEMASPVSKI